MRYELGDKQMKTCFLWVARKCVCPPGGVVWIQLRRPTPITNAPSRILDSDSRSGTCPSAPAHHPGARRPPSSQPVGAHSKGTRRSFSWSPSHFCDHPFRATHDPGLRPSQERIRWLCTPSWLLVRASPGGPPVCDKVSARFIPGFWCACARPDRVLGWGQLKVFQRGRLHLWVIWYTSSKGYLKCIIALFQSAYTYTENRLIVAAKFAVAVASALLGYARWPVIRRPTPLRTDRAFSKLAVLSNPLERGLDYFNL